MAVNRALFPADDPLLQVLAPDGLALSREQLANPDTAAGLAEMVRILKTEHRAVPAYLQKACEEYNGGPQQTARFAVGCYWEGEEELGKIRGVVGSRTGMIGKDEIVELQFDPAVIDAATLAGRAKQLACFRGVASTQPALVADPEQQHVLANHPEFANIPLTPMQRTKVNAALADGGDLSRLLSPAQLRLMQRGR